MLQRGLLFYSFAATQAHTKHSDSQTLGRTRMMGSHTADDFDIVVWPDVVKQASLLNTLSSLLRSLDRFCPLHFSSSHWNLPHFSPLEKVQADVRNLKLITSLSLQ
jgi:hypothetical protein